jgi:hypothetical protein
VKLRSDAVVSMGCAPGFSHLWPDGRPSAGRFGRVK